MSNEQTSGDEPSLGGQQVPRSDDVRLGGDSALLHLVNSLNHSDPVVRKRAAFMLASRGDERAYDALMQLYEKEGQSLRVAVIKALGKLGDRRAVDFLIERLEDQSERRQARIAAAEALGIIGDQRAVLSLMQQIETPERGQKELIRASALSLAKIGDPQAVDLLLNILTLPSRRFFEEEFRTVIFDYVRLVKSDDLIAELLRRAANRDRGAIYMLSQLRDPSAVSELIRLLKEALKHDLEIAARFVEALGFIGSLDATEVLLEILTQNEVRQNEQFTGTIIHALGSIKDDRSVLPLIELLDTKLYWHVTRALEKIGDRRAVAPLVRLLHDARMKSDDRQARCCIDALGALGDSSVIEDIAPSLSHADVYMRQAAVKALGQLGTETSMELLLKAAKDSDTWVRVTAIEALDSYYSTDPRVPDTIIAALEDTDGFAPRVHAAQILGRRREQRAVSGLIECLNDRHHIVVHAVVEALRHIGTPEAIHAVRARRIND